MARRSRYTESMVALILEAARGGCLNYFDCCRLARHPEFASRRISPRAIASKIRTLGLDYRTRDEITKNGELIQFKSEIIGRIQSVTGISGLQSLEKADKTALSRLASALEAHSSRNVAGTSGDAYLRLLVTSQELRGQEPENDS